MITEEILSRFANLLGPKGFTTDPALIDPWLADWRGHIRGEAAALISPATTDEVAATVALAASLKVPLVPQGGNTSTVAGATPPTDGSALILSLRRMNRIREVNSDGNIAVVEAGTILANFHQALAIQGKRFPLTLGSKGSATIGGLVSTNAGGTQVLRFGTMRGLVLGIEAVLPDGAVHHGLAALKKDNRGYDLNQLFIGAEGTLGVVTAASLKLVPAIVDRAVAWVAVESPQSALPLLRLLESHSGDAVESFEIVANQTLSLVVQHIPGTRAPLAGQSPWHVLIEYVVSTAGVSAAEGLEPLIGEALHTGLASDAVIAASEAQAEAFWRIRDSISEAERSHGPAVHHDVSVPVDAMPDFMTSATTAVEAAFPGTMVDAFGHLGDGNVHFNVRAPHGAEGPSWRADAGARITRMVHDLVVAAKGSISAEHGIGQIKIDELVRLSDPARIKALRAIKTAFDPDGIMNPGKLLPLAPAPAAD
jgi:FAD/FMN-containing dehydrogenase